MKKMVLILGAGASVEADLPTGAGLKSQISSMLNFKFSGHKMVSGDPDLHEALGIYAKNEGVSAREGLNNAPTSAG